MSHCLGLFAALNNCAFVSTEGFKENPSKPFCFLMDAAMLGACWLPWISVTHKLLFGSNNSTSFMCWLFSRLALGSTFAYDFLAIVNIPNTATLVLFHTKMSIGVLKIEYILRPCVM